MAKVKFNLVGLKGLIDKKYLTEQEAKSFEDAYSFNQDLSRWDVSKVETYNDFDDGSDNWTKPKPNFKSK